MPAPTYSITPKLSHGALIRVGRGDTPTWTASTGLLSVEIPSQMPQDIDITNQSSASATEETMPGFLPAIDFGQEMMLDDGSDWDTALTALNARNATTGAKELHLVEITVGGVTKTFVAYLKEYRPTGELKGAVKMTATWRLMATVANAS